MVAIAIFSREAMWKSNSRWATEDLIWKSDITAVIRRNEYLADKMQNRF